MNHKRNNQTQASLFIDMLRWHLHLKLALDFWLMQFLTEDSCISLLQMKNCFCHKVVRNGHCQRPVFKGYFFSHKDFLALWVLILNYWFGHVIVHFGTPIQREKIILQLSVKKVLSVSLVCNSTLRFAVSAAACGVWMREMNCAIRTV